MDQLEWTFVFADKMLEWNCSEYRCHSPSNALNSHPSKQYKSSLMWIDDFANWRDRIIQDRIMRSNFIMVQRNVISDAVHEAIDYFINLGKLIVIDLDDAYPILPWGNPAHGFWLQNKAMLHEQPLASLFRGLTKVSALTSPSKVILADWKAALAAMGYDLQTIWLPNFASGIFWRDLKPKIDDGWITVGWGGSVSHYDSWFSSGVRQALQILCSKRKNVRVMIVGNDPRIGKLVSSSTKYIEVHPRQRVILPGVAPNDWPQVIKNFDIYLAPLSGIYDMRRSWIKAMEAIIAGIPFIFTNYPPYAELGQFGIPVNQTENIEKDTELWLDALNYTIDHLPMLKERAEEFSKVVGPQLILENVVPQYVSIWQSIELRTLPVPLPEVTWIN